jgi:hypothetical protein
MKITIIKSNIEVKLTGCSPVATYNLTQKQLTAWNKGSCLDLPSDLQNLLKRIQEQATQKTLTIAVVKAYLA